jgi:shikimate dehydrogenase
VSALNRYAVIGHPVAHSKSPWIHAAFAQQLGIAQRYEALLCPLDGFGPSLRAFAQAGGRGCNVTVPFKFEAFALALEASPRAQLAQAANTLVLNAEGDVVFADNTDGIGLVRAIEADAGRRLAGQRVLLVGAGGAAAGVLGPLLHAKPAQLLLANRSVDKALAVVQRHAALAQAEGVALAASGLDADAQTGFDVLINASASSLEGNAPPVPAAVLHPGSLAIDLMYGPAAEAFMAWARKAGAQAGDGLAMLVEQAAEAFALWHGQRPHTAPVLAALRAKLAGQALATEQETKAHG